MRRLSIIDLATGRQPISNEDGTVWVVFNGEIYNYRELRASLIRAAIASAPIATPKFWCTSMKRKACDGIQRLRGMFAYAIWDSRDRITAAGARPLRQKAAVLRRASARLVFRKRAEVFARRRRSA
jgi:asparagine synthase (glutamine-hydrolysing)